jgi:hypothetical protein
MPFIDKKEFFTVCESNENYSNKITELCHVHDSKALFNETQMMVAFFISLFDEFFVAILLFFRFVSSLVFDSGILH